MKIKITFILFFLSSLLITAQQTYQLDPAFGNNGIVELNLNVWETSVKHQVLQPDGKIMVAGYYQTTYEGVHTNFVMRFNANGTIDNTFGTNGRVTIPTTFTNSYEIKIHLFTNGAFLLNAIGKDIRKFNADGSPDTGFGNGAPILPGKSCDIAIQNDNKFVVTYNFYVWTEYTRFKVQRYEANGTLDTSFLSNNSDYGVLNKGNWGRLLIQPDGKVMVIHIIDYHYTIGGVTDYTIFRLNPDGSQDINSISPAETHSSVGNLYAFQSDGKLLVRAYFYGTGSKVRRFNANLTTDTSYGDGTGFSPVQPVVTYANAIKLGVDDNIFSLREASNSNGRYIALHRISTNGYPHVGFANQGVQQLAAAFNTIVPTNLDMDGDAMHIAGHGHNVTGLGNLNNAIYLAKLIPNGILGVDQQAAGKSISFFPNPAADMITFNENIQSALVYAVDGKLMDCRLSDNKMDITSLVGGVYIIKGVSNDGVSFTEKIIKL